MKYQKLLTATVFAVSCVAFSAALAEKQSIDAFVPPDDADEYIGAAPYPGEMETSELNALEVEKTPVKHKADAYEPPLEDGDEGIGAAPF